MSELQLDCEVREGVGSSAAKKIRAKGFLPAVIYGHEKKPETVAVAAGEFHRLYSAIGGHAVIVALNVKAGGRARKENVIIKEVQRQATTDRVLNIDFQRVSLRERVRVEVAVTLAGTAPGVDAGGWLDQVTHQLQVECPAAHIPEALEVDVSQLNIGDLLTAADVALPKGATLLSAPDTVVATVVPRKVEEAAPEPVAEPELIRRRPEEEEKS